MKSDSHTRKYFKQVKMISDLIDKNKIEELVPIIYKIKKRNGRIFFLGVGGSAANSSHAVNDFRKLCEIECYCPTDNVSEFSARINDEGWNSSFSEWLKISRLNKKDGIFIFSVGGGNLKKKVSVNLIKSINYAKKIGAAILGVVSRDGGYTKKYGDKVVVIPEVSKHLVTPHAEAFQAVIWHCLVSHPLIQSKKTKW